MSFFAAHWKMYLQSAEQSVPDFEPRHHKRQEVVEEEQIVISQGGR